MSHALYPASPLRATGHMCPIGYLTPLPFFFSLLRPPPRSPLFPYTTLFRSRWATCHRTRWAGARRAAGRALCDRGGGLTTSGSRSEEHTSELQSRFDLVCRLLLEKKNKHTGALRRAARKT